MFGVVQVVEVLLEAGANVDSCDADQRTALRAAAWGGHDEIVTLLLKAGADVRAVTLLNGLDVPLKSLKSLNMVLKQLWTPCGTNCSQCYCNKETPGLMKLGNL